MKAKELAELLLQYPDFDVQVSCLTGGCTLEHPYPEYTVYSVEGIEDIGHSNKVICLECV